VENGSLREIAEELIRMAADRNLAPGTVVLFGAPAQLKVVSVEYYAAEWKLYRNCLKHSLGELIVLPLIPISPAGIDDRKVVRGLIDFSSWLEDLEEPELKLIRNTRKLFEEVNLGRQERGPGWADMECNLTMPVSLSDKSMGTTAYVGGGWGVRPTEIKPLTEKGERYWVGKLVNELNRELHSCLETKIVHGRTLSAVRRQDECVGKIRMSTLGASNAMLTAAALRKKGINVYMLGRKNWTVSATSVEAAMEELGFEERKEDIVVLQCLDNRCFYAIDSNGSLTVPVPEKDGKVHILGRVSVAKDLQLEILLEQLDPMLESRRELLTILVCPLVRYMLPCCDSHGSEKGGGREEEGKRMLRELGTLRRELKTRLIKKGYVNTILVDPLAVCGAAASVSAAENMMSDMYHMKPAGQAKVAENIREVAVAWLLNKKRKSSKDDGPDPKRSKQDPSKAGPSGSAGGKGNSGSSAKRGGKGGKLF
jgi:hypothetical protein